MKEELGKLGLNTKESHVYMYLVEYGISPASEISRKINIPKSSVNFIADNLWERGIVKKSFQSKTGYYEADINLLEESVLTELSEKQTVLQEILPTLREKNKNTISRPKITFIDGIEGCKHAYLELLKIKNEFLEFGAHKDLQNAFGVKFMDDFISQRVKKKIFCDSIGTLGVVEQALQKKDTEHLRSLKIFGEESGTISSSIAIYENKVLILNLKGSYNGVLIENTDFAQTMHTIFKISKLS